MAGIYVHIPFCKTRCVYCGFFSTTLHEWQDRYVDALLLEYEKRKGYLHGEDVETVYIGGGTPSQLSIENINRLLSALPKADEVTMECNPDDVSEELVTALRNNGVNRVSMGVQTFNQDRLRFLRRRHTASQAHEAVRLLREGGIRNISIDLMFGFPQQTLDEWEKDINEALTLGVEHISAYSLMYEEGTPLYAMLERGEIEETDEETCRSMYYTLIDMLIKNGYEHYEISNFSRTGYRSRHNSSYWRSVPYLGLGAAAHSYDRTSRQWNDSNVLIYINKVENANDAEKVAEICDEREWLDDVTTYNDVITTGLRTREGISLNQGRFSDYLIRNAEPMIKQGLLVRENDCLHLSREGLYVSDNVMSELIYCED